METSSGTFWENNRDPVVQAQKSKGIGKQINNFMSSFYGQQMMPLLIQDKAAAGKAVVQAAPYGQHKA